MKFADREVDFPNRVKLTKVGEPDGIIYDLQRAEGNVIKPGTPLNAANLNANNKELLSQVYPVGSIYINAADDRNPTVIFGFGTWEAWGQGRMPLGIGANLANNEASYGAALANVINRTVADEKGGSLVLTTTQIPSHNHTVTNFGATASGSYAALRFMRETKDAYSGSDTLQTNSAGSGANQLPPYQTCYMWKRVL